MYLALCLGSLPSTPASTDSADPVSQTHTSQPGRASDPLKAILLAQPDYTADVVYEGNPPIPNPLGWVSRVAKKGTQYRIDVASPQRDGAPGELKHVTLIVDRSGRTLALDPDTRMYAEVSERDFQRAAFMISGLWVVDMSGFADDIGASKLVGVVGVDSHRCDIYRTRNSFGNAITAYVATDLKNLVVRLDVQPVGVHEFQNVFILSHVVIDPPGLSDKEFEVPADYALAKGSSAPPDEPAAPDTVDGPEDESLVRSANGFVLYEENDTLYEDGEFALRCVELPSLRDTVLQSRGDQEQFIARVAGPDAEGRIAYVLDLNDPDNKGHTLEVMRLDGKRVGRVFHRDGDTIWDDKIGDRIALSRSGGLLAFVSRMEGAYFEHAVGEGELEIWDIERKAKVGTGLRALDYGLAWSPDAKRLFFVQRIAAATLGGTASRGDTGADGFGKRFAGGDEVPAVCVYDLKTQTRTVLHVGIGPVVFMDGASVLVGDGNRRWRRVDAATGSSVPVSLPGGLRPVAFVDADLLLYLGVPTKGIPLRGPKAYSSFTREAQLPSLKIARLSTGAFQTILPVVHPIGFICFGPGPPRVQ
jgi:hypothetical protein